ncbi:hypothetical protein HY570_02605 [Candidatus Micrarchaeota archaeon]|nr:hypothetical protein [Candidatus Micrarchaeota archaeon]
MLYITSSRKPCLTTRRLCKSLSLILPRSVYENRGKKNIDDVASRAKSLGKQRVVFVYEQKGNPYKLSFLKLNKDWKWLTTEIILKSVKLSKITVQLPRELKVNASEKLKELFYYEEPESDEFITLNEKEDKVIFTHKDKVLLELKVGYYESKNGDSI